MLVVTVTTGVECNRVLLIHQNDLSRLVKGQEACDELSPFLLNQLHANTTPKVSGETMSESITINTLRTLSSLWIPALICLTWSLEGRADSPTDKTTPNVVLIFTDDQGYQDVGVFGAKGFETPHLDRLAEEGRKFTNFCVSQAVCSASRAALLTGCLPNRVGIRGALGPKNRVGLHSDEMTLAELLKQKKYATAMYGKWHLGHHPQFLPTRQGFDEYYGLPYSNDMWPKHPTAGKSFPPLPLIEGEEVIELNPDQSRLTTEYTRRAVKFIEDHSERPFFVYLAHSMPHVPLFVSEKYQGKSERGLYGDVIEEIDWSVGQIVETLDRLNLTENTLIIFTSDNGPWLSYGDHGGSALPLREGKGTAWEGGVRVPCIMKWPGHIPAGTTCDEFAATIDVVPTIAEIVSAKLPSDRLLDGLNILSLMTGGTEEKSPHDHYYYYWRDELHAVRSGPWKLHFPHKYRHVVTPGSGGLPGKQTYPDCGLELYNLEEDISESKNVLEEYPEIVAKLKKIAEVAREDLGDQLTKRKGKNNRPPGKLAEN